MNVTLRKKKISGGSKISLYLDYYPPILHPETGKFTRREFLSLYLLVRPRTEMELELNRKTLTLAKNVCADRQIEISYKRFGFLEKDNRLGSFVQFFKVLEKKSGDKGFEMARRYFEAYAGPDIRFIDVDEEFAVEYRDYLLSRPKIGRNAVKGISNNSAKTYFGKFRTVLKAAFKKKLYDTNLYDEVDPIKEIDSNREWLTYDEFLLLANTRSHDDLLERACLFSCVTGLRFSDIKTLLWSEISGTEGDRYIQFIQEKTDGGNAMPLSDYAYSLLGERGNRDGFVFDGLKYSRTKPFLIRWLAKAGIDKELTFHCLRHTFATLQGFLGTSIFVISKMLGHRNVTTTQRYVKVVEETKREAVNRMDLKPMDR